MNNLTNGILELLPPETQAWPARKPGLADRNGHGHAHGVPSAETLRRYAWEIGEKRPAESFTPAHNHVGLAMVLPAQGFAHWRIQHEWIDQTSRQRGDSWHHCRMILRLYDVTHIVFNGFNAHHVQDHPLPAICGHMFIKLPRSGTWQLAEVGFLLRSGEFIPAARSQAVPFAPEGGSPRGDHAALLITENGQIEPIGNVWDHERILHERRQARLRKPLRIAAFALAARDSGQEGPLATFVSELAAGQCAEGHEVHVFVPASGRFTAPCRVAGVHYHPLDVTLDGAPLDQAIAYAQAAEKRLQGLPPFDLIHLHEWMTGLTSVRGSRPTVLSLSSVEATRRNGTPPSELSREIEHTERELAQTAGCLLTPDWLRDKAVAELGLEAGRVRAFPMEGRMANDWERPLDLGQVKQEIGVGPLDRLILFVGPLEHGAGVDLLVEALPVLLQRWCNLRVAFAGAGNAYGHLAHRAHQVGAGHAVRLLGHVEMPQLTRLLRAAEALALPSRFRVPFDDAVVDLARRAGRPVITTLGGPAHLVRHEENGILTYDNPGSMVWALDRILGDPVHAERMGQNGRRSEGSTLRWCDVAKHYLELCASYFPELTETRW